MGTIFHQRFKIERQSRSTAVCNFTRSVQDGAKRLLEGHLQFDAGVVGSRGDLAAGALLEVDQAVALHGLERARQVRLGASGLLGQLGERLRLRLDDQREQGAVAVREHLGHGLQRLEPDLRLVARRNVLPARDGHGPLLVLFQRSDSDLQ